ncbi:hypothetical protein FXB40_33995 [Bradyrhizobium rifense]|jgi:hypothetical protein|uniref:Uncharacterized protein n=1 Tax=Bradyrhizobium rifense TaxID=515499 RepID=A0A5D3KGU8_9BRAD|nr:hypothetical protein [Bradyrhizobium rifense]TYL89950.1 hypothetical protein FXB40_33995 [Bradyrhizobium rifense]
MAPGSAIVRLRSIAPPPVSMGITPPPYDRNKPSPYHPKFDPAASHVGRIKCVLPTSPTKTLKRPGWVV